MRNLRGFSSGQMCFFSAKSMIKTRPSSVVKDAHCGPHRRFCLKSITDYILFHRFNLRQVNNKTRP